MIALESLIGFGLLFLACSWLLSAASVLLLRASRSTLATKGSGAEKRAAELALFVPPILAAVVTLTLAGFSLVAPALGDADHCTLGAHRHLHLCLVHGSDWAQKDWALWGTALVAAVLAIRLLRLGTRMYRARLRLRRIEQSCTPLQSGPAPILSAPSERPFCFLAGISQPRIYVAASLWERLSDDERNAMLEHEFAHLRNRDLLRGIAVSIATLVGAPIVAAWCKSYWEEATERLCDRTAADRTGRDDAVASALLKLIKGWRPVAAMSFVPGSAGIEGRIISVLSQKESGEQLARHLFHGALLLVVTLTLVSATLVDPLHHALETLIGSI